MASFLFPFMSSAAGPPERYLLLLRVTFLCFFAYMWFWEWHRLNLFASETAPWTSVLQFVTIRLRKLSYSCTCHLSKPTALCLVGIQNVTATTQEMHLWRNIMARSRKHWCCGKGINITYSDCVIVALGVVLAMCTSHIFNCNLRGSIPCLYIFSSTTRFSWGGIIGNEMCFGFHCNVLKVSH